MTLERAYRHAALVLWPQSRTLAILASAGIGGAVAWVEGELDRNAGVADARVRRLASELTAMWPTDRSGQDKRSRTRMLGLLCAIGDDACISHFLHDVVLSHYDGSENEDLPAAMDVAGTEAAGRFLPALIDAQFTQRPKKVLALLRRVDDERDESADAAMKEMLRKDVRSVLRTVAAAPDIRKKVRSARASAKQYDEVVSWPPRSAADTLRANSNYASNEYFLTRFADQKAHVRLQPRAVAEPSGHRLALPWRHRPLSRARVPVPGGRGG